MIKRLIWPVLLSLILMQPCIGYAQNKQQLKIGDDFPGFFSTDLEGNMFFLKDHIGEDAEFKHAGIIFSFCASWCKPCKKEIPELEKLHAKYADKGIAAYLIAVGEDKTKVGEFISDLGTSLPVLVDRYQKALEQVGRPGLPHTVFIDRAGKVRFVNTGFSENTAGEIMERLENEIKTVADSGSSSE
ncbi:MAG: redoxin domain-containing protein [Candidatus Latescibacteria bacterium]|nr:redoxin domain-containing protein [Candidatus Latescibacterota bacterium]